MNELIIKYELNKNKIKTRTKQETKQTKNKLENVIIKKKQINIIKFTDAAEFHLI